MRSPLYRRAESESTRSGLVGDGATQEPRADFSPAEVRSGKDLYFAQSGNRSAGSVVYRRRAMDAGQSRIAIAVENVASVRLMSITLFPPGSVQTVHILERQSDGGWGYYNLTRTRASSSLLSGGFAPSRVNRAVTFYRSLEQDHGTFAAVRRLRFFNDLPFVEQRPIVVRCRNVRSGTATGSGRPRSSERTYASHRQSTA
jgi:hypothetical protein